MYLKRLKDLREDRDLKQVNIAEILKITRSNIVYMNLGNVIFQQNIFVFLLNFIIPQLIIF